MSRIVEPCYRCEETGMRDGVPCDWCDGSRIHSEICDVDDIPAEETYEPYPWCQECGAFWTICHLAAGHQHVTEIRWLVLRHFVAAAREIEVFFMLAAYNRCPQCRDCGGACWRKDCYYEGRIH